MSHHWPQCVSNRLDALKLKITLLDYLMMSIKDHSPAYEPGQQGKEVPIYIDCGISEMTLDWDIAWYKQGPNKRSHVTIPQPQDDADNRGNYKTIAYIADYLMGHFPASTSVSGFPSALFSLSAAFSLSAFSSSALYSPSGPFSPSVVYSPPAPYSPPAHFPPSDYNHSLAQFSDLSMQLRTLHHHQTSKLALHSPEMVEFPTSHHEQPSVMPGVYLSTPQSPAGSSAILYSPMDSVPESCMVSSAMDASSLQVDDDATQSNVQEVVSFTDTLHMILMGLPQWRSTLVCLWLKMKVVVCCGNAQNPFLLTQPGYTEQKTQFVDELFEQSLVTVNMTRDDLEKVVSIDRTIVITSDEMLALAAKWLAGFISDLKHMAKLAIMDTRSLFSFGLHDTSTADPSLLANKCVEHLMCFMAPQSTLLPILANGLIKLLKYEIVKLLVFYVIFHPSSTSGARVIIGDEEPAIFRDATLPPVWMVAFVLTTVPDPLFATTFVLFGWVDALDLIAILQVSLRVAAIERQLLKEHNTIITILVRGGQSLMEERMYQAQMEVSLFSKAIANLCEELKTKCRPSSWPKTQVVQQADKDLVTSQVTQQVYVDILLVDCDQYELSSATQEKCEAWLATSWQFEVDFPQVHEVPELYEHLSRHDNDFLSPLMEAWFGRVTHHTYLTTSSADSMPLRTNNIKGFKAKKNKMPDALKSDFSILELKKQCAQAEVDMFSEAIACTARIQCTDDGTWTSSGTAGTFESRLPANSSQLFDHWFEDWCSTSSVSDVSVLS
ncbi:hypothetical protein BDR04DRAFT_1163366 [Suillus decipiens]|nr:hypothetical protein BDR04DRAFT_1163366 [Suillus decipiens]